MSDRDFKPGLYQLCRRALKAFLLVYNRMEVHGAEHVPATGGCILAANHVSFLDPPVVGSSVRTRVVRFMARDTLGSSPFTKWWMEGVATVMISREKGDVGALKRALQALKEGDCLGLFPEGTRSVDGELKPAKGGIGFLIGKAGVPVVPMYVDGTYRAFSRHHRWIRPSKVRIFIGPAIQPAELAALGSGRDSYERIGELVMSRIAALRPGSAKT